MAPGCCNALKKEFCRERAAFGHTKSSKFGGSCIPQGRLPLLIFRCFCMIWTIVVLIRQLSRPGPGPSHPTIVFFTIWTYIMIFIYFLTASITSIVQYVYQRKHKAAMVSQTEQRSESSDEYEAIPWYNKIQWIWFNIIIANSIIVTVVYWSILYQSLLAQGILTGTNFWDVSVHGLNSAFVLIELIFNHVPVRLLHFSHPLVYIVLYVIWSGIFWALRPGLNVLYPGILDWRNPSQTAIACVLILLVLMVIHLVVFGVYKIKLKCCAPKPQHEQSTEMA